MIPIESYVGYYFFLFSFYCYLEKEKNSAKLKKKKKKGRYSLRTTRIVWIELLLSSYLKRKKRKGFRKIIFFERNLEICVR